MTDFYDGLTIRTLATPGLGDRSYLAIADGWAIAVDVQRDLDRVEQILDDEGARLGAVLETHLHNDYLTGGLVLARRHGAEYIVPEGPKLGYSATRAVDGLTIRRGPLTVRGIDAPGHTDAHTVYSVHIDDGAPQAAFTGGSLLLGATGRSDLLGTDRFDTLARQQYWSVRRLARLLGGDARILPTHGFGSFCAAGALTASADTVAAQLAVNPAYLLSEDEFVADMRDRLGDYPTYYAFMGAWNTGGVRTADMPSVPAVDASALTQWDGPGRLVVDVRARRRWSDGHVPGSVSIDAAGPVATWLGWIAPIDTSVVLVAETPEQRDGAARELHRIGFDDIAGAYVSRDLAGVDDVRPALRATFSGLAKAFSDSADPLVLDVRETAEWRTGHVAGAIHVPAHDIAATFDGALPRETPWVYCAAGLRSTIATSQLLRLGVEAVAVDDAIDRAAAAGVPWCDGVACSDYLCTSALAAPAAAGSALASVGV